MDSQSLFRIAIAIANERTSEREKIYISSKLLERCMQMLLQGCEVCQTCAIGKCSVLLNIYSLDSCGVAPEMVRQSSSCPHRIHLGMLALIDKLCVRHISVCPRDTACGRAREAYVQQSAAGYI